MSAAEIRAASIKGISLMVLAMFLLALMNAATKMLGQTHHVAQVVFVRNFFVMIPVAVMVWYSGGGLASLRPVDVTGQALRAGFQLMAAMFIATSMILMPIAEAESLFFAAPLFVAFLSMPLLGERVGWRRRTAILVGFLGVLIMLRPTPELIRPVAFFGVAAAVFIALRDIWTRRLRRTDSMSAIMFWSELGVIVGAAPVALWVWQPMDLQHLLLAAAGGLLLGCAQLAMVVAYVTAEVATVAPFRYSAIIWSTLAGFAFFGELPDLWVIAGAAVVIASGLYLLHRETRRG